MYRFLLRPAWLLSHVAIALLVAVLVSLGLWQFQRLDDRRAENERIGARAAEEVRSIDQLADVDASTAVGDELTWRRAAATGRYLADEEVHVRSRSLGGQPGFWVLTPLRLDDGSVLVVNRGWIPFGERTDGSDRAAPVPEGSVRVEGLLQPSLSSARPSEGEVTTVARVDLDWYRERLAQPTYPVYLQLAAQDPPPGEVPLPLDPPGLDEGPHLSYGVQWFIFASIAVVGYPIILRRVARSRTREGRGLPPDPVDTDGNGQGGHPREAALSHGPLPG